MTQDFHRGLPGASVAPPPAPRLDAVSIVDAVGWETRLLDVVGSAASLWETGVVEADTDSVPRVVAAERGPWSRTAAAGVGVGVGVKHAGLATAAVFSKLGSSLSQAF